MAQNIFDYLLEIAEKSCPERVARQGNLDIWEANRAFVVAGVKFVKVLAREIASTPQDYRDLAVIAITIYHSLLDSEQAVIEELARSDANWEHLKAVGTAVTTAMYPNIEALLDFDERARVHENRRQD